MSIHVSGLEKIGANTQFKMQISSKEHVWYGYSWWELSNHSRWEIGNYSRWSDNCVGADEQISYGEEISVLRHHLKDLKE